MEKNLGAISEFFFTFFWEALSNLWRIFLAHILVESNGILSQLSKMVQHLYIGWKNKGSRAPNIFNQFYFKIHAFLNHSKTDVFTHPNIKIAKTGNAPIHRRGFHTFFKNSWPSPPPKISHIVTSFLYSNFEGNIKKNWDVFITLFHMIALYVI